MEKNTVVLNVERYNELYDLEKATKAGKRLKLETHYRYGTSSYTYYYTDDEIAKELRDKCEKLEGENKKLEEELKRVEKKIPTPMAEMTIENIKQMNYWQFKKWKAGK